MSAFPRVRSGLAPAEAIPVSRRETPGGAPAIEVRLARRRVYPRADHRRIAADPRRIRAAARPTAAATRRLLAERISVAAATRRTGSAIDSAPATLFRPCADHSRPGVFSLRPHPFFVFSRSGCARSP